MRVKLLSVITLLIVSIAVTSCLDSDNKEYEYSSDNTVHVFELDSIYKGVYYKFTIDNVGNRIFNVDSVPYSADSIIKKIRIRTFETAVNNAGYFMVSVGGDAKNDTLFNYQRDSLDLSKTMENPLLVKVYPPDGGMYREYRIEVRRHRQDPDTLVWSPKAASFSNGVIDNKQETVILKDVLYTFTTNNTVYSSSIENGEAFTMQTLTGFDAGESMKLSSIINHKDILYTVTDAGNVYASTDAVNWQKSTELSENVVAFTSAFPDYLTGIVNDGGVEKFAITNTQLTGWELGEDVPPNFPVDNFSHAVYKSNTSLFRSVVVGKTATAQTQTMPWYSLDGKVWIELITVAASQLPYWEQPSIMYYDNKLYAFGEGFDSFYTSTDGGLVWNKVEKKVFFHEDFKGRNNYSMAVDKDNFIWLVWSKGVRTVNDGSNPVAIPYDDEVWKGRINRTGFDIK